MLAVIIILEMNTDSIAQFGIKSYDVEGVFCRGKLRRPFVVQILTCSGK